MPSDFMLQDYYGIINQVHEEEPETIDLELEDED